jgi:hypothetical protein
MGTKAHLRNGHGLYQGTTSVVPVARNFMDQALAPANPQSAEAEAQVEVIAYGTSEDVPGYKAISETPSTNCALLFPLVGALLLFVSVLNAQSTFLGMDRNDYPGDANMRGLKKTFAFTGYWLNNPPGASSNKWTGKRQTLEEMGYGFLLLFNGREYKELKASGNASRLGIQDAGAAARTARREGFHKQVIIFLDQEQGGRMLPEQRAYIHSFVDELKRAGFRAGIYCSGIPYRESGSATVITANDIREHAEGRDIRFFISNDQCGPSPGCVFPAQPPKPSDSGISFADAWQYAQSPRRPQITAACRQTYASDGSCYPPGVESGSGLYVDVDTATSADPSNASTRSHDGH